MCCTLDCNVPGTAKLACSEFVAPANVKLQVVAVPLHKPDHPEKMFVRLGVSVSITTVFGGKIAEQPVVEPLEQLIPDGLLLIAPVPAPDVVTANVSPAVKLAVIFSDALTVTMHKEVPVQPLHPPK